MVSITSYRYILFIYCGFPLFTPSFDTYVIMKLIHYSLCVFVATLTLLAASVASPPEPTADCRVRLPDIAGSYEGECRKGKAHGYGRAVGRDIYEGEFVKGLPDGTGTYTWANGNYYEGEFVKGAKEGQGKMVFVPAKADSLQTDSIQAGLWENDQFLGEEI